MNIFITLALVVLSIWLGLCVIVFVTLNHFGKIRKENGRRRNSSGHFDIRN